MGKNIERIRASDGRMYELRNERTLVDSDDNQRAEALLDGGEIRSADGRGVVQRAYTEATNTESTVSEADMRAAIKRELLLNIVEGNYRNQDVPEDRYNAAFGNYIRRGFARLSPEDQDVMMGGQITDIPDEARALAVGTGSAGGFTVPEGFVNDLRKAQEAFGGLRAAPVQKLVTDSGNDLPYPTGDDTGNTGELLAENTQAGEADPSFGQVTLKSPMWSSKIVKISFQLAQDSAFNMESWLATMLGERIGRAQAPYFITGTGTGEPEGIVTGAPVGHTSASGQLTTLIYDDFVSMLYSVDRAYRNSPNAAWVLSDEAEEAARSIKTATEEIPLWQPSMTEGEPDRILGKPYYVDVGMAAVVATAKPLLFGDLSAYVIRDVGAVGLIRFDERYADSLQLGFLAFQRTDGRQVIAGSAKPYTIMQMSAS